MARAVSERRDAYVAFVLQGARRLLSGLDREASSTSFGNADREHWAWKFRDLPITMLQGAICPLSRLWKEDLPGSPFVGNDRLIEWIAGAAGETCRRQTSCGAFDSVGPNTRDAGVTLAIVYVLTEALRRTGAGSSPLPRETIVEAVSRACRFARTAQEDYAFISNHRALFALAWLNAAELLQDTACRERAEREIAEILRNQSPDGWYREYEGPDPGYETLGISYLARYWRRTGTGSLLESLRRSVEFLAHCVHPDGSIGGVYGSRHTSLYYPDGFEILAGEIPLAGSIADFVGRRLSAGMVVTPSVSDAENLWTLLDGYLEAARAPSRADAAGPPLPLESLRGVRYFPDSAIASAGTPRYYGVTNLAKGGVCRVFDKASARIAYEDAGYLVRSGRRLWTSQRIGLGRRLGESADAELTCTTTFAEVRQPLPTPVTFLLLRALNLTAFRIAAVGRWIRRTIVRRLILEKRPGPFVLTRTIRFEPDEVRIDDRLERRGSGAVAEVVLPRAFTAIHMGSARYFHASDLEPLPAVPVSRLAADLDRHGRAEVRFAIRFGAAGSVELVLPGGGVVEPAAAEMAR